VAVSNGDEQEHQHKKKGEKKIKPKKHRSLHSICFDVVDVDVFSFFSKKPRSRQKETRTWQSASVDPKGLTRLGGLPVGLHSNASGHFATCLSAGFCKKKKKGENNSSELSSTDTLLMIVVSRGFPRGSGHLQRKS
jgi:hypothetical protein